MTGYSEAAVAMSRTKDPVDRFISLIGSGRGQPDLVDLGHAFLGTWSEMPGVMSAAVAADPAGPVLLERSCRGNTESWLVTTRNRAGQVSEPCWVGRACRWSDLAACWDNSPREIPQVLEGSGRLPGGEPWAVEDLGFEPVACAGWMMAPIQLRGQGEVRPVAGTAEPSPTATIRFVNPWNVCRRPWRR